MFKTNHIFMFSIVVCGLITAASYAFAGKSAQLTDIPEPSIRLCYDSHGQIADGMTAWNSTDIDDGQPQARLVVACQSDQNWVVVCQQGGRGTFYKTVIMTKKGKGWTKPAVKTSDQDPKLDCASVK